MDDFGIKLIALSDNVEPNIEKMMDKISALVKKYNFATGRLIKYGEWTNFIYRLVNRSELDGYIDRYTGTWITRGYMGYFVKRKIEEYKDNYNTTYFLQGDQPLPKVLIDDIDNVRYVQFAINPFGEKMYYKISNMRFGASWDIREGKIFPSWKIKIGKIRTNIYDMG